MRVIFLRHGARDVYGAGDSGLNHKGAQQAQAIASSLAPQGPLPVPARLIASPKKRAKETLAPLASLTHLQLEIDARLDERSQNETRREFDLRIRSILNELTAQESQLAREATIYLCSHLDWLEAAILMLDSDSLNVDDAANWSNCEYRVFRIQDALWSLAGRGVVHG